MKRHFHASPRADEAAARRPLSLFAPRLRAACRAGVGRGDSPLTHRQLRQLPACRACRSRARSLARPAGPRAPPGHARPPHLILRPARLPSPAPSHRIAIPPVRLLAVAVPAVAPAAAVVGRVAVVAAVGIGDAGKVGEAAVRPAPHAVVRGAAAGAVALAIGVGRVAVGTPRLPSPPRATAAFFRLFPDRRKPPRGPRRRPRRGPRRGFPRRKRG